MATPDFLNPTDTFIHRHIGPTDADAHEMLATLGLQSMEELSKATVPADIRLQKELGLPLHRGEQAVLEEIRAIASENQIYRSLIGMGYHDCVTPGVIQRNIFENPSWYTQYTPYQAEIAQGRLEALVNFQTVVIDLTWMKPPLQRRRWPCVSPFPVRPVGNEQSSSPRRTAIPRPLP